MTRFGLLLLSLLGAATPVCAQSSDTEGKSLTEIEQLMSVQVQTASLRKQTLQDAPANVTVVTAEDIHRHGYRTLAEVLANTRSFYTSSDGDLRFAGVRGFSLLGDYNTRFLVMINGHALTDNVYGAMYYFGQDFPLDMDIVHQIEIVRGPTSALYGSNGLFATINIITLTPTNAPRGQVSSEVGSFGQQKITASSSFAIGGDARLLISASGVHEGGRTVDFAELAQAGTSPSRTDHAESGRGYHTFALLTWKNWSVTALFSQHKAIVPTGWFGTDIGNTGTSDLEERNFVEAAWSRPVGQTGTLEWRGYYDQYRYDGLYDYTASYGYRNLDGAFGDWVGNRLVYRRETKRLGNLTVGGEASVDLRNVQYDFDMVDTPSDPLRVDHFRTSHRRTSAGLFVQDEIKISTLWTAYIGARIDASTHDSPFLSPRVALVRARNGGAYKLMYGRAFRNPSTFERYWEPSPGLTAERIDTVEVSREQKLCKRLNLIASTFHYRLGGLIEGVPVGEGSLQYRNTSKASATGLETELNGYPLDWLETSASFSIQRTRGVDSDHRLQNSPVRLGQFKASVPALHRRLIAAGAVRFVGPRMDAYGSFAPAVALADLTFTAPRLHPRLDLQFGLRNLLNTAYSDPLSPEHQTRLLPAPGRSIYVKLTWHDE